MATRATLVLVLVAFVAVATAVDSIPQENEAIVEKRQANPCRDNYSWCPNFKILCQKSPCIKKECPLSCGLCVVPTLPPTNPPLPACKHSKESASCRVWQKVGYCKKSSIYYPYMKDHCPGTCGFCRFPVAVTQPPQGAHLVNVNVQECLQSQNTYRARHQSPALIWDANIAKTAQAWALKLAKDKRMKHESGIPYGELLWSGGGWVKYTCKKATDSWYSGVKYYDYKKPGFSMDAGTFTQLVWKSSRRLGVGIAKNGDYTIIVARYSPPGNYRGQFPANVLPPKTNV